MQYFNLNKLGMKGFSKMKTSSVPQGMPRITSDPRQWSLPDAVKIC
jgi:hypothetical protein